MKLRRSDIARLTLWSGSIFEKESITSNGRNATRRAAPGASCVWTKPAAVATAARCLDFDRPINEPRAFNSALESARDRWLQENRSGPRPDARPLIHRSEHGLSAPADSINR